MFQADSLVQSYGSFVATMRCNVILSQVDGSFPKNERRGRQTAMTSVSKYRIFFWFLSTVRKDISVPV